MDANPDTYIDMMDEAIGSVSTSNSYKDLPEWLYKAFDELGLLVSEEERVQKSLKDWNPNE